MRYRISIALAALAAGSCLFPACSGGDSADGMGGAGGEGGAGLGGSGDSGSDVGGDGDVTGEGDGDSTSTTGDGSMGGDSNSGAGGSDPEGTGGADSGTGGSDGSGGDAATCGGQAVACADFVATDTCEAQSGCRVSGMCSDPGGGTDCEVQTDAGSCETNGCTWTLPCENDKGADCASKKNENSCLMNDGACEWVDGACQDRATGGCQDQTSADACGAAAGCLWTQSNFSCGGTATECSALASSDCSAQSGCEAP